MPRNSHHSTTPAPLTSRNVIPVAPDLIAALKGDFTAAAFLQQVWYWQENARVNDREENYRDGYYWVYNTAESWNEQIHWVSLRTLKRVILDLERAGLLISRQYQRGWGKHTKWYRVDREAVAALLDD